MLVRHDTNYCLTCKEKRQLKRFNLYNRKNIKEFIKKKEFKIISNGIDCFLCKRGCIDSFAKRHDKEIIIFILTEIKSYYNKDISSIKIITQTFTFILAVFAIIISMSKTSIDEVGLIIFLLSILFIYWLVIRTKLKDMKRRENVSAFLKLTLEKIKFNSTSNFEDAE